VGTKEPKGGGRSCACVCGNRRRGSSSQLGSPAVTQTRALCFQTPVSANGCIIYKTRVKPSLPAPLPSHRCAGGVPVFLSGCGSAQAAALGWKRRLWGSKSQFFGKTKGNSIENWGKKPPRCTQKAVEPPASPQMGTTLHCKHGCPVGP